MFAVKSVDKVTEEDSVFAVHWQVINELWIRSQKHHFLGQPVQDLEFGLLVYWVNLQLRVYEISLLRLRQYCQSLHLIHNVIV